MLKITKETQQVLDIIKKYEPIRSTELIKILKISSKTVYKHLAYLLNDDLIKKFGSTPKVFYALNKNINNELFATSKNEQIIDQNYLYTSPSGEMIRGFQGFQVWCAKNKFELETEEINFIKKFKLVQKIKKGGLISANKIILSGKKNLSLDNIFFSDFYNLDHFGKTKLGQLVYLGKSSQNKELITEVAKLIKFGIQNLIIKYNIKLIGFIPPTIERNIQFLDILKKKLNLNLTEIKISKVNNPIRIPQKTLRKLEDRIINAQTTITVDPTQKINSNVLIIDDATGSGATLNETAKKIRKIAQTKIKIIGYSVVGSFKGFDVISEV